MQDNYSQKSINILKASLPFMPINMQKMVSSYIKIEEFNHMVKNLNSSIDDTLHACELEAKENKTSFNPQDLFCAIKPYLSKNEIELINMVMNFSKAYNIYNTYGLNNLDFNNLNSNNQSFNSTSNNNEHNLNSNNMHNFVNNNGFYNSNNNFNSQNEHSNDNLNNNQNNTLNIETLKNMLSPSQRAMFDTYSALLNNQQNTNLNNSGQ